jgi:hypothetical protein
MPHLEARGLCLTTVKQLEIEEGIRRSVELKDLYYVRTDVNPN